MAHCKKFSGPTSIDMVIGNEDLLMEILLRLPAKSVLKFKSVSKQWKSLVSPTSFHIRHTLHHSQGPKPQPSFIFKRQDSMFFRCCLSPKLLLPLDFGFKNVEILQSCNGLVLFRCGGSEHRPKECYVFNPTTMKSRKLELKRSTSRLFLVFDPLKSIHYKVVCFRTKKSSHWIETYDSSTRTWKKGVELHSGPRRPHEAIYWNDEIYYIRPRAVSQRFVLEDKFYEVQGPPSMCCLGSTKNYVMESNGHLHCIALTPRPDRNPLAVLEMDKKNRTWFVKYRTFFREFPFYKSSPVMDVLGMIRGEKERDSAFLFGVPEKIMLYRFFDQTCEELVNTTSLLRYESSHQFVETLVPV